MADERGFADVESMRPVVRAVFGSSRSLLRVERLAHGSKKGAYRLTMDDGTTSLVYVWDGSEDYWQGVLPEGTDDPADPFSHASGLALFEAAARRLASAGVRCPELLLADQSRALYPADIAVVEDVAGGSLEALLESDPAAAGRPLSVVAGWLAAMSAVRSPSPGKVAFIDAGGRPPVTSCEKIMPEQPEPVVVLGSMRSAGDVPSGRGMTTVSVGRSRWIGSMSGSRTWPVVRACSGRSRAVPASR